MFGGNNLFKTTRDSVMSHNFLHDQEALHDVAVQAFHKCVTSDSLNRKDGTPILDEGEEACVQEYVTQYTQYAEKAYEHFGQSYERMVREAMNKMRQMEEMSRARGEAARMRSSS
eukprot:PhF_6_TR19731/c0_g1_i2/m.28796